MKIVVLDGYSLNPGDLSWDGLKALGDCTIYDRTPASEVLRRVEGAEVVLTNKVRFSAEMMDALPHLRYIGVLATGYNTVDIDAARKHGIVVTNIPAYSTDSVAQMVFAHLLNIADQVGHYSAEVRAGRWSESKDFCFWDTPLFELNGKTMGLFGLGHTGMATARLALAFGMRVLAVTSKKKEELPQGITPVDKHTLFAQSDIVSLHAPLTPDTRHLVDKELLLQMKPTAILINTSRGPLVNEQDLADALNNRNIYAAGVDVLSREPPKADNPLLSARNCYITPHIAWATFEARSRLMEIAVGNVKSFLGGAVRHNVAG